VLGNHFSSGLQQLAPGFILIADWSCRHESNTRYKHTIKTCV
jgi:hypothetical protein